MSSRSRSRTRFSAKPLYCGVNNTGSRCTSYNSNKVHGNQGWSYNLSSHKRNVTRAKKDLKTEACVRVAGKILCFATMAAAAAYLYSLSKSGGRRTRKQYKKRSTRSLSK